MNRKVVEVMKSIECFWLLVFSTSFHVVKMQPSRHASVDEQFCNELNSFTREQREFCYENVQLMKVFINGYQLGYKLCQDAFSDAQSGTRWNCTNIIAKDKKNVFFGVPFAREGSKEHAIMMSFTGAGVLYVLTRACLNNTMTSCRPKDIHQCQQRHHRKKCQQQHPVELNVPLRLIRTFFRQASLRDSQTQLNLHNQELGLQILRRILRHKHVLQDEKKAFKSIQNRLKTVYTRNAEKLKKKHLTRGKTPTLLLPLRSKLVYFLRDDRFSYCHQNENWFWSGIGRRPCKLQTRDSFSLENCVNMCCDYGYVNIPQLTTVCSGNPRKCRAQSENKYYCKYRRETVKQTDSALTSIVDIYV